MKRFLVIACLLCTVLVIKAAEDVKVGNLWYSVTVTENESSAIVIKPQNNESYTGDITIPSTVSGTFKNATSFTDVPVTEIRLEAFKAQTGITSVVIQEGVTFIGANAFNGATNLTSIQIPASVTTIMGGAFSGCSKLSSVTFASVKALCGIDFETVLSNPIYYAKSFKVGDAVQNAITIPSDVSAIKKYAFYNCESLTSVTIEEGAQSIGVSAFAGCTSLESVTIPASVTEIDTDAFNINSTNFVQATFSSINNLCAINFFNIKSNPLYVAHHLYFSSSNTEVTKVTLPAIETIKPYTFAGASNITEVTVPGNVTKFGNDAFNGCSKINTVNYASVDKLMTMDYGSGISNPLYYGGTPVVSNMALGTLTFSTDINNNAFTNSKWLTEITIGPNVNYIGENAFKGCSNLTKITFTGTSTLQTIGKEAFRDCSGLTAIALPESLTAIGTLAFRSSGLSSITIPATCTEWGTSVFELCTQLTKAQFNSDANLKVIPNYIFHKCYNLKDITIPDAITTIGEGAFAFCDKLANPPLTCNLITIGSKAFEGCTGFTDLMLSNAEKLEEIGTSAFNKCSNITMVSLPASINAINDQVFADCTSLADVYMLRETVPGVAHAGSFGGLQGNITLHVKDNNAVEAYKNSNEIWVAFKAIVAAGNSKLTFYLNEHSLAVIEGESGKPFDQTQIPNYENGKDHFSGWWNNQGKIVEVPSIMPAQDMEFYGYLANEETIGKFTYLLQPAETMNGRDLGARATVIENHLTQSDGEVEIPGTVDNDTYTVESIAPNAFEAAEMTILTLPSSIKTIGSSAFKNCQNLQSVNIPAALTTISDHLFEGCTGLNTIEIPATVTEIGYQAFNNTGLTGITIPSSITKMGNEVFKDCKNLGTAVFAEGFTLPVPQYTFWNCTKLTDVTLRNTMGIIGLNAFQNCDLLKTIELPEGITFISAYAFADCDNLDRITLPSTTNMVVGKAFTGCPKLKQITVNTEGAPKAAPDAFDNTTYETAFLYVKDTDNFTSDPWYKFTHKATQTDYDLIYKVNGEIYKTIPTKAGSAIKPEASPEGYNNRKFSEWINLPDIMPAEETVVEGNFLYEIKFYDGPIENNKPIELDKECKFFCGDKIELPLEKLSRSGFKFSLSGLTENVIKEDDAASVNISMPAHDINVIVTYDKAEDDLTVGSINYKVYMEDNNNRAEVIGCSPNATTLDIPDAVPYKGTPYPVKAIQANAFRENKKITSITLPQGLETIGFQAFRGCLFEKITIPSSVTQFGEEAFRYCSRLNDVTFASKNSISELPAGVFSNCVGMESIDLPNITTIGERAFEGCSNLAEVDLPASVTTIGSYAYAGCTNIEKVIVNSNTNENLPAASESSFDRSNDNDTYSKATLYVLEGIDINNLPQPWSIFGAKESPEGALSEKCKTPIIEYKDGKLTFTCETEGVTFVSRITSTDVGNRTGVNSINLYRKYLVEVYAQKDGAKKSDVATKEIYNIGDANGDGIVEAPDASLVLQHAAKKINLFDNQ